jgi:hypothetical protein
VSVVQAQRQIHRAFGPAVQERSLRTIADHAGLAMDAAPGSGGPIRRPDPAARSGVPRLHIGRPVNRGPARRCGRSPK